MEKEKMIVIAKARWIWHCERCMIDMGKKKVMRIDTLLQRLGRELDRSTRETKT